MWPPVKRVFEEKRRLMVPILGGLALNVVLYGAVVYPLGVRAANAESRARTAEEQLRAAERDEAEARGLVLGRDRTGTALKSFYTDVLPPTLAEARQATFLRLAQLAEQHHLEQSRQGSEREIDKTSSLARLRISMSLRGNYEDIRRFIYQVESGSDFIVIDSVSLRQAGEPGAPLMLDLGLSTYYQAGPGGA